MTPARPMSFFDTPLLKWTGAKWQLADWIVSTFPPHTVYVEPFCGSAAVYMRKNPAAVEVLNDLNSDVVNFFEVLRTRAGELIDQIRLTPYSREEYELSYEYAPDPLERARRFYVRCWQSFAGSGDRKTGWSTGRSAGRGVSFAGQFNRLDGLQAAAAALKDALIENDDALKVIERYDTPKTLFYVDPPYVFKTRSEGARKRYKHEMTDEHHRQLATVLNQVRGMVVLSGYDSELYRELYVGWTTLSKTTTTNGNSTAIEYLWVSPRTIDMNQLPLFGGVQHLG